MTRNNPDQFSNKRIVQLLKNIAASYLLSGENRFKVIAYQNAAGSIEHLTRELKDIWEDGKLQTVSGLGPAISGYLDEYFKHGKSSHFEAVLRRFPASTYVLMEVSSIGAKTAYKLVKELNLTNDQTVVDDLLKMAKEGRIAELETFGEKSQAEISDAVTRYKSNKNKQERMPLPYANQLAAKLTEYLLKNKHIKRIDSLGSLRRKVATIGDIDLAVVVDSGFANKVVEYFINYPGTISVANAGDKKASILVHPNVKVDLRIQEKKSYGSMLQYFTGSKTHNIKLREYAMKKGLSLSEYGIKEKNKSKIRSFSDEKSFYNYLGLQYVPPEIREGTDEIALAIRQKIPKLIEPKDLKGDLHIHSSYDLQPSHDLGIDTYSEILNKATELGYEYVGFSDHNPKTSGLYENQVISIMKNRRKYIDQVLSTNKVDQSNYFIGLEVDVYSDGKIALPEKAVDYVDYLIVSIHSNFNMTSSEMTKRILKALDFRKVKILGHPTARLLNKREGVEANWREIYSKCRGKNIAVEINSWYDRLDLPDTVVREARNEETLLVINSDAHSVAQMENISYGVSVAKRGWCRKYDIINTRRYREFKKWLLS